MMETQTENPAASWDIVPFLAECGFHKDAGPHASWKEPAENGDTYAIYRKGRWAIEIMEHWDRRYPSYAPFILCLLDCGHEIYSDATMPVIGTGAMYLGWTGRKQLARIEGWPTRQYLRCLLEHHGLLAEVA